MFDVILGSAGAQILIASSSDDRFPPENILDGSNETFWATTGMFPQEFIVKFSSVMVINRIRISCFNVKKLVVEATKCESPEKFDVVAERVLESTDSHLQNEDFTTNDLQAQCLRFVIESGHDHFVSVHSLHADGQGLHG